MYIMFPLHCGVDLIWTRSLRRSAGTPQFLSLLFSVFLGGSVQHWEVISQYLYVVVLIFCTYMLLCCCGMSHIALRGNLFLLGKNFASIQSLLCFFFSLLKYFLTIWGNILVYLELQENTYLWKHTSMATKCRIFVLQNLKLGSYRCMMVRFLHWHYFVIPNQLCSLLLKTY